MATVRPENVKWKPDNRLGLPHELWSAHDTDATEVEVTNFVAALVTLLKPALVIETGTYLAHTTIAIARALTANDRGTVHSYEIDTDRAATATRLLTAAGLSRAQIHAEALPDTGLPPNAGPIDIAFLDSGMNTRAADLAVVWPALRPGGIVVIHDAAPDRPPGHVWPSEPCDRFDFGTPRGLVAYQKPWP